MLIRIKRITPPGFAVLALFVFGSAIAEAPLAQQPERRVVSIGDIHGSSSAFAEILRITGLIDTSDQWIGGDTVLVQTGDFLDRGVDSLEVMDLMMRMQIESEAHGGKVVILLGNHEVMNLLGVYRDVAPETFDRLVDNQSVARRKAAFKKVAHNHQRLTRARGTGTPTRLPPGFRASWYDEVPLGYIEYQELMSPRGKYGKWLRTLPSAFRAGDVFFVHGGISPAENLTSADAISVKIRDELDSWDHFRATLLEHQMIVATDDFEAIIRKARIARESGSGSKAELLAVIEPVLDEIGEWYVLNADSPLWFRGFASWTDHEGREWIDFSRDLLGVDHFVVGHTPVRNRLIQQRFDGAVFLTDTGMLADVYQGRPSALEIRGDLFEAVYSNERLALWQAGLPRPRDLIATQVPEGWPMVTTWFDPEGKTLPFTDYRQALDFLSTAKITASVDIQESLSNPRKLTLEKDGIRAHAVFRTIDIDRDQVTLGGRSEQGFTDSYRFEPAAFELSRLLGLGALPPTVLRTIDGVDGSIQLWVEETFTESARQRDALLPPDPRRWFWQLQSMYLFDNLIDNFDRNQGNILIDDEWRIALIDHTRSFRTSTSLAEPELIRQCEESVWSRLKVLDMDLVRDRLGAYLSPPRLEALAARRQALIDHIEGLIEIYGSDVLFNFESPPLSVREASQWRVEGLHLKELPERSEIPPELLVLTN